MENKSFSFDLQLHGGTPDAASGSYVSGSFTLDGTSISTKAEVIKLDRSVSGTGSHVSLTPSSTSLFVTTFQTAVRRDNGVYTFELLGVASNIGLSSSYGLVYQKASSALTLVSASTSSDGKSYTANSLTSVPSLKGSNVGLTFASTGSLSIAKDTLSFAGSSGKYVYSNSGSWNLSDGMSVTTTTSTTLNDEDYTDGTSYVINGVSYSVESGGHGTSSSATTVGDSGKSLVLGGRYSLKNLALTSGTSVAVSSQKELTIKTAAAGSSFYLNNLTVKDLGGSNTITFDAANATAIEISTDATVTPGSKSDINGKKFTIGNGATVEIAGVKYKAIANAGNTVSFSSTGEIEIGSGIDTVADEASDDGASDDGASGDGASDDGASDDGASGDGASDDGASGDNASDDGTSDDGTSDDGTSDDGTSDDGTSDDGASDDGASDDGASDDGASDDGASDETETADDDTADALDYLDGVAGDPIQADSDTTKIPAGGYVQVGKDVTGTVDLQTTGSKAAYLAVASGTKAKVNVGLGTTDGSFISNGGPETSIDFASATNAKVALGDENSHATFSNYDWTTGNGIATEKNASGLEDLYDRLATRLTSLLKAFSVAGHSDVTADVLDDVVADKDTSSADANSAFVNLYYGASYNDEVTMGLTGKGASYIDTDEEAALKDSNVILVGNYTGEKSGTASLKSGSGNDAVYAGDGDTVDAGTGLNHIYLSSNDVSTNGTSVIMGSGSDVITGVGDNDVIISESAVEAVRADGTNVVFTNTEGGQTTVNNVGDGASTFNVKANGSDYVAVAGYTSVNYTDGANYYNASNKDASIVADTSSASIWLNKEVGAQYGNTTDINGDIKYINASNVSGRTTLAGSAEKDNVIYAGKGASSLWGGGASDDSLIGGSGSDTFFYMKGDGNDSIKGATANDTVRLEGGLTLSDITKIDVGNASVALEFSDGGSLTLNSNSGTKFKIDGATYTYDKSAGEWKQS